MADIDVTRSSSRNETLTKDELVDGLKNVPQKDKNKLKTRLSAPNTMYNADTLNRGNQVLNFLKDEGYTYELQARANGKGLLAKVRGLGGSDFLITVASSDRVVTKTRKDGTSYESISYGSSHVGNVTMNNRSFYTTSNSRSLQNSFDMFKALTGRLNVQTANPKKNSQHDKVYNILDKEGRPISRFFRRAQKEPTVELDTQEVLDNELSEDDTFLEAFGGDDGRVTRSPLEQLIYETNERIAQEKDENDRIMIVNQGFQESIEVYPIEVDNTSTYDGLDLDMLLALNDRSTLADTIVREMIDNEDFTLDNENIKSEEGLKDLLMENTAGVRAQEVSPMELGPEYQKVIDLVYENLERQNVENADVTIDEDHVIHWTGEQNTYHNNGNLQSSEQIKGDIGQIFLPDEEGIINTNFRTVEASSDRNYRMIPSYTAYYADRSGYEIVPKTVHTTIDGVTGDFVIRENGQIFKMYDIEDKSKGKKPPKAWTLNEMTPELLSKFSTMIEKSNNPRYKSPIATEVREKKTLEPATITLSNGQEVVADENGKPLCHPKKGTMFKKEQFPESILKRQIASIEKRNKQNPENPMPMIGTVEKRPSLRDAIRVRGFEQSLQQNIEAVVARQVLQGDTSYKDTVSLNKLYHGDVYGTRIKNENLAYPSVIDTYRRRVRFPNDITDMTADELDEITLMDKTGSLLEYRKSATHRHNLIAFEGVFDRSLSSDGQSLGKIKYLNESVTVNQDGSLDIPDNNYLATAPIFKDMSYTWGDPSDRSMMGANQVIKSRNVEKSRVALMTYKGYTFEDGSVISARFAREQGAIVNGYDENGEPIPLQVGDKISDAHGNKSTISYIATPENDPLFEQNPDLDVIMNPHSIPSRKNTGVVLEIQDNAKQGEAIQDIMYNGAKVADSGALNVVITDITAKDKTHTYEKGEGRLGRSFGVQEAWVANALELDGVMDEVYSNNTKAYERLRNYMNVTGLDIDENGVMYQSNGIKYDPETDTYNIDVIDFKDYDKEQGLSLPESQSAFKLPFNVDLPSGEQSNTLYVLPEEFRKTQELYDGGRIYHDYSRVYAEIAELSADFETQKKEWLERYLGEDHNQSFDFSNPNELNDFMQHVPNEDRQDIQNKIEQSQNKLQGKVSQLTERVVDDKLGGHLTIDEEKNRSLKDGEAVKRSIMKRDIMGKQVPHSATSVVTADPNVDINTIKVSPELYDKMNLKNPDQDRVLLWRDPALHDGSMRSFKIQKDENIVGVGINPLVTESFGMDFDGDTVGLYAPKSSQAQKDLREKAALENNLIDPTTEAFTGNIGMDFVASAHVAGYVGENITQGRLKGREAELEGMNAKDQLQLMLTEMAKEENGAEKINQLWKDTVTSEEYNIGASTIDLKDREAFKTSMMKQATIGAKGKPKGIQSDAERRYDEKGITSYAQKMKDPEFRSTKKGKNGNEPTVMQHYDRAVFMKNLLDQSQLAKDDISKQRANAQLKYMLTAGHYASDKTTGEIKWKEHPGSLARDYNRTREAQAGKVDLTGRAGAKSQKLVSIMYDDKDGAMSAMEVTEPLTQATLKLKHNPEDTPEIEGLLNNFDKLLNEGGQSKNDFANAFTNKNQNGMYDKIGLNVNRKHLDKVFDALSDGDKDDPRTRPISDVMNDRMSPLMKVNMNGYDAMRDMAKENNEHLQKIAQGHQNIKLKSFKDGDYSGKHVPKNLKDITSSSIEREAENCYKIALNQELQEEKQQKTLENKQTSMKDLSEKEQQTAQHTLNQYFEKENDIRDYVKNMDDNHLNRDKDWYIANQSIPVSDKEAQQNNQSKHVLESDNNYQNYKRAQLSNDKLKDVDYKTYNQLKAQHQQQHIDEVAKYNVEHNIKTKPLNEADKYDTVAQNMSYTSKDEIQYVEESSKEYQDVGPFDVSVTKDEAYNHFINAYHHSDELQQANVSSVDYIEKLNDEMPLEKRLELDEDYKSYRYVKDGMDYHFENNQFTYYDYQEATQRLETFDQNLEENQRVIERENELSQQKELQEDAKQMKNVVKNEPEGFEMV